MILYPAIDIREGRAVRLMQGDYERETAYDADPVAAAERWAEGGAEWLHVVTGGGSTVGNALVDHDDVALITFTGSPPVGWGIRARALALVGYEEEGA